MTGLYNSPPFFYDVRLMVSATHDQQKSMNIKWEIPAIYT